uniref:Uncharacterized protein n=1 Tax=Chelonoidis abingdonii TaxID=106734 RepID=A0A8C0G0Z8_CHEAB
MPGSPGLTSPFPQRLGQLPLPTQMPGSPSLASPFLQQQGQLPFPTQMPGSPGPASPFLQRLSSASSFPIVSFIVLFFSFSFSYFFFHCSAVSSRFTDAVFLMVLALERQRRVGEGSFHTGPTNQPQPLWARAPQGVDPQAAMISPAGVPPELLLAPTSGSPPTSALPTPWIWDTPTWGTKRPQTSLQPLPAPALAAPERI